MLLDRYEPDFCNSNFKEAASKAGWVAYRGELVLVEGEVADAQGRRKPPQELLRQAAVLAEGDELRFISGHMDELQHFSAFLEKYGPDLKPGAIAVLFVVNIDKPFTALVGDVPVVFIPLVQGMAWNELIDLVALEKSDFKGQSSADKVVTLYNALKGHTFKYPQATLEDALTRTNSAKRETHGAV